MLQPQAAFFVSRGATGPVVIATSYVLRVIRFRYLLQRVVQLRYIW